MTDEDNEMPPYIGPLKTEYYQAYFGEDTSYYLPVMIDFVRGKKFNFNVWACFCGLFWLLYRKLYRAILVMIAILLLESTISKWAVRYWNIEGDLFNLINLITIIILSVLYGYTGNYFLMRKAQKKIALILSIENEEIIILDKIKKAGSVNPLGVTLVLVYIFGISLLTSIFIKAG